MEGLATQSPSVLHSELHWLGAGLDWVAAGIEVIAIAVMLIGAGRFVVGFLRAELSGQPTTRISGINYERQELGRYILAGLELFIVSDIIHTVLSLRLDDLVFLGLLVLIRAAMSYFLDREIRQIRAEEATR
ncbi:DUF1622 domain-containing protein [Pontivivens ytuae]|uniref:DUF1622 domain-containing protein n=1 Tax=Pontivivens ytuae TaxID=2789856 RepID=A0A7S9LV38_9RHOB|nr:DUF1622 domain-containing protein [Pontivivens ytuae]QPH55540.1 DUF1622 domain-containing protein [Pontivivens ytuae]